MSPLPWTTRLGAFLLRAVMRHARGRFESQTRAFTRVNTDTLRELLQHNHQTVFGREHGFATLRSVEDYRRALPLSDSASFEPYVERIARGEQGVLTADRVEYLGRTSGTTGSIKRHPITRRSLQGLYRSSLIQRALIAEGIPASRRSAQALVLINARLAPPTEGGVKTGSLSAIALDSTRQFSGPKLFSSPPFVFELKKHADALYLHLLFGLRDRELGSLQATFASGMLDMVHLLERRGAQLVEDIAQGRVDAALELEPEQRRIAEELSRPDATRAREVEAALAGGRQGLARRLWPQLTYASTIGGAGFSIYTQQLLPFLEGVPLCPSNYISTEAALGVAIGLEHSHYCLLPGTAFFEFIPEAELEAPSPRAVLPEELTVGEAYEVVLSTRQGLYRYRLGDVVRVVGRHHQAPVVEVLYRRGTLLNMMGEKTSEHAARRALEQALGARSAHLTDYSVVEETETLPGRYVFYVEFEEAPGEPTDVARLGTALDEALKQTNPAYALSRGAEQLGVPAVHPVSPGTFEALREVLMRRGASASQVKVPRAVRDSELKALLRERRIEGPRLR